jgi:hypothetical protein
MMSPETTAGRHTWRNALVACAASVGAYLLVFWRMAEFQLKDPDRYYHLAVSRQFAQDGFLRTIPQVVGLGWDQAFQDKEFLFHVLTGAAWWLWGEGGTTGLTPWLASAVVAVLTLACVRGLGPLQAALCVVAGLVVNTELMQRLLLLRPHVLAMVFFACMLLALRARSRWGLFAGSALFVLAYHAFFIPLALLGLTFLYGVKRGRHWMNLALFGVAGLGVGILVNPYFPGNVILGLEHLSLALNKGLGGPVDIGQESVPIRSDLFVEAFAFQGFCLVAGVWAWRHSKRTADDRVGQDQELLLLVTASFMALTMKNPRADEYAVPLCALLLAVSLESLASANFSRVAVAAAVLLNAPFSYRFLAAPMSPNTEVDVTLETVRHLPPEASGSMVFNCEWHRSPFLLYLRPDVKVLDVLEPALLAAHWPEASAARQGLADGKVADPGTLLRGLFKARYVLCQRRSLIEQLEQDVSVVRLFPPDNPLQPVSEKMPYLYEVRPQSASFLTRLNVAVVPPLPSSEYPSITPAHPAPRRLLEQVTPDDTRSTFMDLTPHFPPAPTQGPPTSRCAVLSVLDQDVTAHQGATVLGVGGGRNVRVWFNGQPLFRSDGVFPAPRSLNALVPLPSPLKAGDHVEAVVCSSTAASYMGAAFSLWTEAELAAVCTGKRPPPVAAMPDAGRFDRVGTLRSSCLAPWAVSSP